MLNHLSGVMAVPGLDPGIGPGHPRLCSLGRRKKDVDARDKRGHDGGESDSI